MASDSELDLAALAAGAERDPTIDWLIDLAETGFAVPVTVVVGGFLITGAPVREDRWGAAIDNQIDGIISLAEEHYGRSEGGTVPEQEAAAFAELRAHRLTDALNDLRARRVRRRQEIEAQVPEGGTPRDLPAELGAEWAREQSRDRYLTLTGASVLIPPGRREEIGTVRVDIRHVGAWWPARFETAPEGEETAEAESV